jgi:hypothetical protein
MIIEAPPAMVNAMNALSARITRRFATSAS